MRLKSLHLSGYAGIPHDRGVVLGPLGTMNVLIGPNNAGKSSIIRFLIELANWLDKGTWSPDSSIRDSDYWLHDKGKGVTALVELTATGNLASFDKTSDKGKVSIVDTNGTIRLRLSQRIVWMDIIPDYYLNGTNAGPLLKVGNSLHPIEKVLNTTPKEVLGPLGRSFVFFDAIRAVDRAGGTLMQSGGTLLQDLTMMAIDPDKAKHWRKFREALIRHVNDIMGPLGMPLVTDVEMKNGNVMNVYLNTLPNTEMPIGRLGTGISQLFIILSALLLRMGEPLIVCIEEPESNLHPGLMRRFVDQLRTFKNVQFIFTSHSHVLLDCLQEEDRVFRLFQRSDGSCCVEPCEGIHKQHHLLDALGIRASSLLQTNCVIWAEGPSDRLYIRRWLLEADPALAEGRDFTFNYYGGTLLAHLEMNTNDNLAEDFVSMMCISRFAVVLMDRDLKPGEPDAALAPRKKKIIESGKSDPTHRLVRTTLGRDIENDIPRAILLEAAALALGCAASAIDSAQVTGELGFEYEIVSALGLTDAKTFASKVSKLGKKMELAKSVIEICDQTGQKLLPPPYIQEMVEIIRQSEKITSVQR